MFNWLRKLTRRTSIAHLPLKFEMDRTDDAQHVVRIYKMIDDTLVAVTDVNALWSIGYQEQIETDREKVIYVIDEQDQQILLALRSMNPQCTEAGELIFPFAPPVLAYLRSKENTNESEASERLQIDSANKLVPTAEIDYDPDEGLTVKTGVQLTDGGPLLQPDELSTTADGSYVLVEDTFIPMPKVKSAELTDWLSSATRTVLVADVPEFFQRDLVLMKNEFRAVLTDRAANIQIHDQSFKPVVRVDRKPGGWLSFDVSYQVGDLSIPHSLLSPKREEKFIQVNDLTWVKNQPKVVARTEQQLAKLEIDLNAQENKVPISQFTSLDEFIESIGGIREVSAAYQEFLDQLTGFQADENYALMPSIEDRLENVRVTLRPYQRSGIHWLDWLQRNYLHGLLADDMGLGKTLQSICVLRQAYERTNHKGHSLIIAPQSVLIHWEREINRFFPEATIYRFHGPSRRRGYFRSSQPIIFISTYATVSNDIDTISTVPFFYLILDEATKIKNPASKRTQAVKSINAVHRLGLSGTPVENQPSELWSLFDFLMKGHLGKHGTFKRVFEQRLESGDALASQELGQRIRPFMLRRLKTEVAKDLPDKIEMDEWCSLSDEQRQLYGGLQAEVMRLREALEANEQVSYVTSILPVLTKLKQICDHPAIVLGQTEPILGRSEKFDWIYEKILEIVQQREQVVVFSHFLDMLTLLEKSMMKSSIPYVRIDGSTRDRQTLIDQFNSGRAKVALCSLQATGYGINLTSGNHVIHADRWWNPAVEDQATDRVHRIGQDKTVYVYRIMVEGTLEERIEELLVSKRQMAQQIVSASQQGVRGWSREELLMLLEPL